MTPAKTIIRIELEVSDEAGNFTDDELTDAALALVPGSVLQIGDEVVFIAAQTAEVIRPEGA